MKRPIYHMLYSQRLRTSFHMPGHQGREPFLGESPYSLDTTELPSTDDLYAPSAGIVKAQEFISRRAGAAQSMLLTGGSTAGIVAMILYSVKAGEEIIIPRSAHKSMIHGCALAGAKPIYVYPRYTGDGYAYYHHQDYVALIRANPLAKAVMVTRPDYYGHLIDLAQVSAAAKEQGQLLLVDEAHGAHVNWFSKVKGAGALGADCWVQSAHKTLPVLTGGAWLHSQKNILYTKLRQMVEMVQTSSPSFVIMQSLDDGRAWMDNEGAERLNGLEEYIHGFFKRIQSTAYPNAFTVWQNEYGLQFDPLRMVITAPQGGFALKDALAQREIDVEMADAHRVVCIPSVMTAKESFTLLAAALEKTPVPKGKKENAIFEQPVFSNDQQRVSLKEALFADKVSVPLAQAAGRVCGAAAGPYPPGVPWLLPGEAITAQMVKGLQALPQAIPLALKTSKYSV